MSFLKAVLKESITSDTVDHVSWERGWLLEDCTPPKEGEPDETIWLSADEQSVIHYIEDPVIGIHYFIVEGNTKEDVISQIHADFDTYQENEVIQILENHPNIDDYVFAIFCLGIMCKQTFEPEKFKYLQAALSDPLSLVREAAILISGYVGWQEFREPLQYLIEHDADAENIKFAESMLAALEKHNWSNH